MHNVEHSTIFACLGVAVSQSASTNPDLGTHGTYYITAVYLVIKKSGIAAWVIGIVEEKKRNILTMIEFKCLSVLVSQEDL